MPKKKPLLVICGPTASGKTSLAVALAKRLNGEVISADSMQVYRHMNIGTAKPSTEEMRGIEHHLIDIQEPSEKFSVAQYVDLAKMAIEKISGNNRLPVLCGGTGLYIDALTKNIQFAEIREDLALRERLRQKADMQGNESVWQELFECDRELANKLHFNNLGRIIRGIEVFKVTGKPLSQWQKHSLSSPPDYRLCMIGLTARDRDVLYRRIDERVELMFACGLLEETKSLIEAGFSLTASQAIGYKELFSYLEGNATLQEAADTLKRETRRYAKRQLTWFRRDERIRWFNIDDYSDVTSLEEDAYNLAKEALLWED